ncbi:MAG: hypothetical protein L6Q35_06525 [Phycisphaerales bacterium]|nr:hypothetical protein [Phycisphaerales bacterium]
MKLGGLAVPVLIGIACIGAVTWSYRHASEQRSAHATARDLYLATSSQLTELATLRAAWPAFAASDAPSEDLTRRVSRVISAAGLASSVLSNVSPDSDQPAGSAKSPGGTPLYLRRSARLSLDGVTLPDLGRFLEAWRKAEPGWVVTSIDLSATSGTSGGSRIKTPENGSTSGRDRHLRALLAVEAIVATSDGSTRSPAGDGTASRVSGEGDRRTGASPTRPPAASGNRDSLEPDPGVNGRAELIEEPH